jgi:nickel/cobalt exporter
MSSFAELLQQGASQAWLYVPTAILLGALHGLEPGHSKTMMAAFIVAIRGSVRQAILLGLAATASHTAVVWLVAIGGMYLGQNLDAQTTEPYFQLASAVLIIGIALWMLWVSVHSKTSCHPADFRPRVTSHSTTRGYFHEKTPHRRTVASPNRSAA